jgi:hypothetical protein
MKDTRSEALQQAHETLVKEIDRSTKETVREGLKTHPLPEGSNALQGLEATGALYRAQLTYDGGDFTADVHVELFDQNGNRAARFTAWGTTIGKGTYRSMGTANLNYRPHEIKDWRFTYILESNVGGVFIRWTGLQFEAMGNAVLEPIPPKGISVGSGYVQVP